MLHRRTRLSSAHVIAIIALVMSTAGSALAATLVITSANIRNGTIANVDIKRGGVSSANVKDAALTSIDVKNGSLLAADFKTGQLPAGATGATGATGPAGPITGALPPGVTTTGIYGTIITMGNAGVIQIPISLPLTFATAPNQHLIGTGGMAVASDPSCPGSVTAPAAAAGHVCVYQQNTFDGSVGAMVNPETGIGVSNGATGSRRGIELSFSVPGAGLSGTRGTWAATGN